MGPDGLGWAIVDADIDQRSVVQLWRVDANTGALTDPRTVVAPQDYVLQECPGIDATRRPHPARLLRLLRFAEIGLDRRRDGAGTRAMPSASPRIVVGDEDGEEQIQFSAIATDPLTGTVWATGGYDAFDGTDFGWFRADVDQQGLSAAIPTDTPIASADFDRSGQLCGASAGTARAWSCSWWIQRPARRATTTDVSKERASGVGAITVWGDALSEEPPAAERPTLPATGLGDRVRAARARGGRADPRGRGAGATACTLAPLDHRQGRSAQRALDSSPPHPRIESELADAVGVRLRRKLSERGRVSSAFALITVPLRPRVSRMPSVSSSR